MKEWKDQDKNQTPVVRTFVVFPFFSDVRFSLCLTWTETVLDQMRLMPRTFCGLCNRDGFFSFIHSHHLPFFARNDLSGRCLLGPFWSSFILLLDAVVFAHQRLPLNPSWHDCTRGDVCGRKSRDVVSSRIQLRGHFDIFLVDMIVLADAG